MTTMPLHLEDGPCAAAPAENALGVMADSGGEVATSEPRDEFERMSKCHLRRRSGSRSCRTCRVRSWIFCNGTVGELVFQSV